MPFVPRYSRQGGTGAQFDAGAEVRPVVDKTGEQIQQLGAGMQRLGETAGAIGSQIQDRIDDARVKEVDAMAAEVIRKASADYRTKLGKAAVDSHQDATDVVEKALRDAGEGLTNDVQREMFARVAQQRRDSEFRVIDRHYAEQARVYAVGSSKARVESLRDDLVGQLTSDTPDETGKPGWHRWVEMLQPGGAQQSRGPSVAAAARGALMNEITHLGELSGASPEEVEWSKRTTLAGAHEEVVRHFVGLGRSDIAQAYMQGHEGELLNTQKDNLQALVRHGSLADASLRLAGEFVGQDPAKVEDELQKRGLPAELIDATMARVEHRVQRDRSQLAAQRTAAFELIKTEALGENGPKDFQQFVAGHPEKVELMRKLGLTDDVVDFFAAGKMRVDIPRVWNLAHSITDRELADMDAAVFHDTFYRGLTDDEWKKLVARRDTARGKDTDVGGLQLMNSDEAIIRFLVNSNEMLPKGTTPQNLAKLPPEQVDLFQRTVAALKPRLAAEARATGHPAKMEDLDRIIAEEAVNLVFNEYTGKLQPAITFPPAELGKPDAPGTLSRSGFVNVQDQKTGAALHLPVSAIPMQVPFTYTSLEDGKQVTGTIGGAILDVLQHNKMPDTYENRMKVWVNVLGRVGDQPVQVTAPPAPGVLPPTGAFSRSVNDFFREAVTPKTEAEPYNKANDLGYALNTMSLDELIRWAFTPRSGRLAAPPGAGKMATAGGVMGQGN